MLQVTAGLFVLLATAEAQAEPFKPPKELRSGDLSSQAGFGCKKIEGRLVCGKLGGSDDDDERPQKKTDTKKKKKGQKPDGSEGERACPPGYIVLQKANKYGAFCEPREGLPPPKQAEPTKCKFPGEVGTPPNCACPPDTEFMGYKGCVKLNSWSCHSDTNSGGDVYMNLSAMSLSSAQRVYIDRLKQEFSQVPTGPIKCQLRGG